VKILLIEDNEDDVETFSRVMTRSGLRADVHVARDAEQAEQALFTDQPWSPGLVLLDLNVPKGDGLDILQRLRADPAHEGTAVVVLSGSIGNLQVHDCARLGSNMFIEKPINVADIMSILMGIQRYWPRPKAA
jgi:two-component system response regulator